MTTRRTNPPTTRVKAKLARCVIALAASTALACDSSDDADDAGASGSSAGTGTAGSSGAGAGNGSAGNAGQTEAGSAGSDDAGMHDAGNDADSGIAVRDLHGGFVINVETAESDDETSFTSLLGRLYDRRPPPSLPIALEQTEGDCELWVPTHPFCDPPCSGGSCTEDSVCTPFAVAQPVGEVSVQGLGDAFTLEPVGSSATYQPAATLPYPPCDEGAEISVTAEGFELQTRCIAPLIVPDGDPVEVLTDQAVELRWEPPTMPEVSRMHIALDISHHGGAKGEILCDVADTGSFDIPAALVTQLIELGVAGYPDVTLDRVAIGTTPDAPSLTLKISAAVTRLVDTGIPSCASTEDCPDDLECDVNRFICN